MKITDVRTIFVDRYLFVQVYTDEGIVGLGESGAWGYLEASAGAVETFKRYLIGQDPLKIEHHWQYLYRWSAFRGAAIMGALSAIDIALWDIAGKHFGVPVYQLLGGKTRDKARVYYHVFGDTKEKLVQGCIEAKRQGFTAVGHLTPFLDEDHSVPFFKTHVDKMRDAIDTVAQYREAVGREVDLCIEIHRRLTPAEAIVLARGIEPYHPFFYEDPILPDNFDAMALVAHNIRIPIAYFVKECVPKGLSPQETIRRLRDQGAVISVPHPLDLLRRSAMGRENVLEIIDQVDAVEVLNARCVRPADNLAAAELALAHGKLVTAGSDAHTLFEVGRCTMVMPEFDDDAESFRDALENAQPQGEISPFWPHFASTYAKWYKRFFPVRLPE